MYAYIVLCVFYEYQVVFGIVSVIVTGTEMSCGDYASDSEKCALGSVW